MQLIPWQDSYSVQIKSIDQQHQKLIDMLNEFYTLVKNKSNRDLIGELITKMKEYTILHFSTEEKMLSTYSYPDTEEHIKEHKFFVNKVMDLENRYWKGDLIISLEITGFLKNWLTTHILTTDKKYSNFLTSKGVQ